MLNRYMSLLAAGTLSFCFAACSGSGKDDDTEECLMCDVGGVRCHLGAQYTDICAPDQTLAAITCSEGGGQWEALPLCPFEPGESGGNRSGLVLSARSMNANPTA